MSPPLILAPDSNWDDEWYADFLDNLSWPAPVAAPAEPPAAGAAAAAAAAGGGAARRPVDVLTHHMYPLGAGDLAEMHEKVLSPRHLDGTARPHVTRRARM